jgi:hypothetical protein
MGREGPKPRDCAQSTCSSGLISKHFRPCERPPCIPCIQDPGKGVKPRQTASRADHLPFGDAFPNGENSPPATVRINDVAKFPCSAASLLSSGIPEARISRSIGKLDTTATARKRQVAISVLLLQSSRQGWDLGGKGMPQNAEAPLPRGVAPQRYGWSLASLTAMARSHRFAVTRPGLPRWSRSLRYLLPGPAFFQACHWIPGSLLHHWRLTRCNCGAVCF